MSASLHPLHVIGLPFRPRPAPPADQEQANRSALAVLRKANAQLLRALADAQDARRIAELLNQRQAEQMAIVAHELRNPLMTLCTTAILLARLPPEQAPQLLAIIERQTVRMTRVIDDLLDVSRVNAGKLRLVLGPVEIAEVVQDALDGCRPAMTGRLQRLQLTMPPALGEMHADGSRLTQILGNLLGNASKYTPCGGTIGLAVSRQQDSIVFTVTDDGIGMTPQALLQVFDPFVQEAHALNFNRDGLGLGLAVVRELTRAHGGRVEGHSDGLGCGSRFVVAIPADAGPVSAAQSTSNR
ncbi:sensor histidine kinase [Rhizobacter sp. P5_C2]